MQTPYLVKNAWQFIHPPIYRWKNGASQVISYTDTGEMELLRKCLSRVDQSLYNDRDIATGERYFLCGPCRDVISRTVKSVSRVKSVWLVSEWVRGLLRFSPCELLLWESGSWGTGTGREPRGKRISAVRSRYHKIGEDTADWVDISVCSSEL
jgi:hypothetical protein